MGFKEIRKAAILALQEGAVQAEERADLEEKNLLKTGVVTAEEVIDLLKKTRGNQYETSKHHQEASIDVHICKPTVGAVAWYIKFYFIDPECFFISVHRSGKMSKGVKR